MLLQAVHLIALLFCLLYCAYLIAQAIWERVSSDIHRTVEPMAKRGYQIDPAALAAATLAGILALSLKEGPYDSLALAASATLVLILIAYGGQSNRSTLQSAAFSAVLGLCSTEAVGYILERSVDLGLFSAQQSDQPNWNLCLSQLPRGVKLVATCNEVSRVSGDIVRVIGLLLGLCWFFYDRYKYKKLFGSYFGPSRFPKVEDAESSLSSEKNGGRA